MTRRRRNVARRTYDDAFKRQVAETYLAGAVLTELANKHKIPASNICRWTAELEAERNNPPLQLPMDLPLAPAPPLALPPPDTKPLVRLIGSMGVDGADPGNIMFQFRCATPVVVAHALWRVHSSLPNTRADLAAWAEGEWLRGEPAYLSPAQWVRDSMFDEPLEEREASQAQWDLEVLYDHARQVHRDLMEAGVCLDQAGLALPMGIEANWMWTLSLNCACLIVKEGLVPGARSGFRQVAEEMRRHIVQLYPVSSRHLLPETEAVTVHGR